MSTGKHSCARRFYRSERGQVLVLGAVAVTMLIGFSAFVIDVGYALGARRTLQNSSDTAAAAGAGDIGVAGGSPIGKALEYSSVFGNKNARANIPGVSISTVVKCTNFMAQLMSGADCVSATSPANTIVVTQETTLNLFLGPVIGIPTMHIVTKSTATMRGGSMPPLDVNIVLDTTASMAGTPLNEAKAGIQALLGVLWPCQEGVSPCGSSPIVDQVGLYIFPPLQDATSVGYEYDCSSFPAPVRVNYSVGSGTYQIVPMTNDFRISTTAALSTTSNLVRAAGGGGGGCAQGVEAIGGFGSYFATAISGAQSNVASAGRANVQNVIIFISDGDAGEYTGSPTDPCQQAVNAATAAKAAGTWVYSIGYGVDPGGCSQDPIAITALETMQRINSDYPLLTKFFNVPTNASLLETFKKIGTDLLNTRIIDDNTP